MSVASCLSIVLISPALTPVVILTNENSANAVVMERPGELKFQRFPKPQIDEDTALLDITLCGICGTDKHIFKNESKSHYLGLPTNFPIIPGHEIVATVDSIGSKASRRMGLNSEPIMKGDKVVPIVDLRCEECWKCRAYPGWAVCEKGETYGWGISSSRPPHLFGGYAESMYLLENTRLVKVPDSIPDEIAVYAEVLSVGYTSLQRVLHSNQIYGEGTPIAGDVVVQGSGPLALAHVIMSKLAGARKIIVVGKPAYRTEFMKQFGVDAVFNVDEMPTEERIAKVMDLLDSKGADVVFECTGYPEVVEEGLTYVKPFGYYLVAGIYTDLGRSSTINVQKLISGKYATVIGLPGQTYQSYEMALRIMEKHRVQLPFEKIVSHVFPLEETENAMKAALSEESMKVAIRP